MRKIAALLLTVAFVWSSVAVVLRAEQSSEKENGELAEALESVKVSLGDGLRASQAQGTPISVKFEIYVCDPNGGRLLIMKDTLAPSGS